MSAGRSVIDFETTPRLPAYGHCMAVRITADNSDAGFKTTSGGIQKLNFRLTPNVWGYFSMDSSGSIHEFSDSQFGHLFASGPDREAARRNMVLVGGCLNILLPPGILPGYFATVLGKETGGRSNEESGSSHGREESPSMLNEREVAVDHSSLGGAYFPRL